MADADVSEEDQNNLLKHLEKKETEYMRLQRHKMNADDFELLTMIGKGAFGEVCIYVKLMISFSNLSILNSVPFGFKLHNHASSCCLSNKKIKKSQLLAVKFLGWRSIVLKHFY